MSTGSQTKSRNLSRDDEVGRLVAKRRGPQLNILLVAAHYPPVNSVAATRPAAWVRALSERGHAVTVLTTRANAASLQGIDLEIPAGEVVRVEMPGGRLLRWLERAAFDAEGRVNKEPAPRWISSLSALLNWARRSRGIFCSARMPDHHDLWAIAAARRIRGRTWDLVVSTHGPYACHAIAYWLRRTRRAERWIADFRDLWVGNHIYPGLPPFTIAERWMEHLFCNRADALTTVSDELAACLSARYMTPVSVIRNAVDMRAFKSLDASRVFPRDGLVRFVYTGTIYEAGQRPEVLFRALDLVRTRHSDEFARLRMTFAGKAQAKISALTEQYGLHGVVSQCGQVPREQALRMQRDADALIFLSFAAERYGGILTAKLFEYLASGTRIISIGARRDEATAQWIEQSERGRDFGSDANAVAEEIVRVVRHAADEAKYVLLSTQTQIDSASVADTLERLALRQSVPPEGAA